MTANQRLCRCQDPHRLATSKRPTPSYEQRYLYIYIRLRYLCHTWPCPPVSPIAAYSFTCDGCCRGRLNCAAAAAAAAVAAKRRWRLQQQQLFDSRMMTSVLFIGYRGAVDMSRMQEPGGTFQCVIYWLSTRVHHPLEGAFGLVHRLPDDRPLLVPGTGVVSPRPSKRWKLRPVAVSPFDRPKDRTHCNTTHNIDGDATNRDGVLQTLLPVWSLNCVPVQHHSVCRPCTTRST